MDQGNRRHFVLVTSGMGTAHGGIGVVSEMILSAMQGASRVSVWNHPVGLPRLARISILAAQALVGRNPILGIVMSDKLPTSPENIHTRFAIDDAWWQAHGRQVAPIWRRWLANGG